MNKKFLFGIVAAAAMVSCGNKYEAKTVELADQIDSINYALGLINGSQIKNQQFYGIDSTEYKAATAAFMDALCDAYKNGAEDEKDQPDFAPAAQNIANGIKQFEKNGLANNKAWTLNEKIMLQAFANAILGDSTGMQSEEANQFFQTQYQISRGDSTKAGKAITAKCPKKIKSVELKNMNDSLNYAFGILNGSQIKMYVLSQDTTGTAAEDFIALLNKDLKNAGEYPQLTQIGKVIGGQIREQEANGLINVPGLETRFELIKQGFVNGFMNYGDWDIMLANQFISASVTEIQYGKNREEGKAFLEAKAKEEGVQVTESGLMYKVIREGKGAMPTLTDTVEVNYEGKFVNDSIFDSSYQRGETTKFGLAQVIKGWTEGLQLMKEGAEYELYIPYDLAYGEQGRGAQMPPYSTLVFKVELVKVIKAKPAKK